MKATLSDVLTRISPGAAGAFNTLDLDMALAVIDSAEALGLPTIVGLATRHYTAIRAPLRVPSLLRAIEASSVPIALHLDHAAPDELDRVHEALDLGFTSIMIDGSRLPFEQNAELTARVVELAHRYGAGVEGELGGVAGEEGVADADVDAPEELPYTDAGEARRFVEQTGVDALAIAVGTAHGIYKQAPHIDFQTISAIAAQVNVPLVMHGATGVSDAAIRRSVQCGIRKINYFSGLLQAAMDRVRASSEQTRNDYLGFKAALAQDWQQLIAAQMRLYGGMDA